MVIIEYMLVNANTQIEVNEEKKVQIMLQILLLLVQLENTGALYLCAE